MHDHSDQRTGSAEIPNACCTTLEDANAGSGKPSWLSCGPLNWHVLEAAKDARVDGDGGAELAGHEDLPEAHQMYAASLRASVRNLHA